MSELQLQIQNKYSEEEKEVIINAIREVRNNKLNSTRKNDSLVAPEIVSCVFEYLSITNEEFKSKSESDQIEQIVNVLKSKFEWIKTIEMEFELHQIRLKENSKLDEKIENYNQKLNSILNEILQMSGGKEDRFKLENLRSINDKIVEFVAVSIFGPEIVENENSNKNNFTTKKILSREMEVVESIVLSVQPLALIAQFVTLTEDEQKEKINQIQLQSLGVLIYTLETEQNDEVYVVNAKNALEAAQNLTQYLQNLIDLYCSWWKQNLTELQKLIGSKKEEVNPEIEIFINNQKQKIISQILFIRISEQILKQFQQIQQQCVESLNMMVEELVNVQSSFGTARNLKRSEIMHKFQKLGEIQIKIIQIGYKLNCGQDLVYDIQCLGDDLKPHSKKGGFFRNFSFGKDLSNEDENLSDEENPQKDVEFFPYDEQIQKIELNGCCLMNFCLGDEILTPPNKELGVVKFEEKFYSFSTLNAINLFASDPKKYIEKTAQILNKKSNVLLKFCLEIGDNQNSNQTQNSWNFQNILDKFYQISGTLESSTQTPTHFVEYYKDRNYEWNNWELRRRALAFANLRNKCTHSMQTDLSHFKRENTTQVWLPKQISSQTNYNKSTTIPKKLRYIGGLRGKPDTKMKIVSLDLDIDQSHRY